MVSAKTEPRRDDRRDPAHPADDEFSPEYLAVLVVCGGTVRDSDWAVLPEAVAARRQAANAPAVAGTPDEADEPEERA